MSTTFTVGSGDYTNKAKEAFLNLLRGGTNNAGYSPKFIDIGSGGDLDPDTLNDQFQRVAPDPSETEVRRRLARARIIYTELVGEEKIKYIAVSEGHEAVSSDINEFGLVTSNQTMIAHFITPANSGPRALKFTKSGYVRMFWEWSININLQI